MKEITVPEFFRYVLSESVRFFVRARLIGIIDENIGIKMPIASASVVATPSGQIDGVKPSVLLNKVSKTKYMQGKASPNPRMTEGTTNREACVKIMPMKPALVIPTRRITPISNVLVSTEISRSE